jgi:hypothetical protein
MGLRSTAINATSRGSGGPPDAVHLIAFVQQKPDKIAAVLANDTGDQGRIFL